MPNILKKIVLYFLVPYTVLGSIIFPLILKSQLSKVIEQETYSKISIGDISFNPFLFKLALSDVSFKDLEQKPLLSFKELAVDIELYSLLKPAIHIKNIQLLEPKISLIYNKDKSINLLNILKEKESEGKTESSSEMLRIIADKIAIGDGKVFYEDYTQATPFTLSFEKIGFEINNIDTNDFNNSNGELRFYSTLGDGGFVDFRSHVIGFKPLLIAGSLDFEASKLYTQWKYAQDMLNLEVADGKVSCHADYYFDSVDLNNTKMENIFVSLEKLRVKPKNRPKDVLNLDSFYVKNTTLFPFKQDVSIDKIGLFGLVVKAKRESGGVMDWLEYIKVNLPESQSVDANMTAEISRPWRVKLSELALENISLQFYDSYIKPEVTSRVDELNIYAKDITLAGEDPFQYSMSALLNQKTKCNSKGSIEHSSLKINSHLSCKDFDITHYNPYIDDEAKKALKQYGVNLASAKASLDAVINLQEKSSLLEFHVVDTNISIDELQLNQRGNAKKLLGFKSFLLSGINISSPEKSITIDEVQLNKLTTEIEKYKNGSLNVEGLIVPRKSDSSDVSRKEEKPYDIQVKKFALQGAKASFVDGSLLNKKRNSVDRIYANVYDIDLKKGSWLTYNISMRVNKKGFIKTEGKLRHTPLKQRGTFEISKLSLIELTPYLQEKAYISIDDGKLSLKGKIAYENSLNNPDLRVEGMLGLESLFVNDIQDDSLLFSLNNLAVKSYTLELNPNRLYIDEVNVNAFFVNAMIDKSRVINFAKLAKKEDTNQSNRAIVEEDIKAQDSNTSFPLRIAKINYKLGSAKFADYSIPIQFKTHIHDLNGVIYSVVNTPGESTTMDISGEVDEYGSTRLSGSLDSSNPKMFTDIGLSFKNLDLNSLSGYSATFAGHEIDEGKLYLDLGYNIVNSELHGTNSIVVKKIKLGKEVEDENVTKLPLGFVIGLLEDSDGVIDIDMPVEGNVDNPDFKYGKLVLKTFGNLILKAVASPFKFLGAVMGIDTEELEAISFVPASALITPPQREKLDSIAKMMAKKPKISLGVSGAYNKVRDKEELQKAKLIDLIVKKSGIKNIKEHLSAVTTDMLEDIYKEFKDDEVLELTKEKLALRYKDEAFERAYQNELIKLCSDIQEVSEEELKTLAEKRVEAIANYLIQSRAIEATRIVKKESYSIEKSDDEFVNVKMEIEVK